jgi:hypothetical protein
MRPTNVFVRPPTNIEFNFFLFFVYQISVNVAVNTARLQQGIFSGWGEYVNNNKNKQQTINK